MSNDTKVKAKDFFKELAVLWGVIFLMFCGAVAVCYVVPFIMWALGVYTG